jgi:hypothetical protein
MKNTKIVTGIQTYTFTDEEDHVFASFRLNPMDVNLAARALEVGDYFEHISEKAPADIKDLAALNKEIEDKISYVLGYDAKDVFGEVTATTVFPSGEIFAVILVDTIIDAVQPAMKERQAKMEKAADKYLRKYE